MEPPVWHSLTPSETAEKLPTNLDKGLSSAEAKNRLERLGPNALKEEKPPSAIKIFIGQFRDFMVLVLIAAAVISGFIGDAADTAIILIILLINASIGFYQEIKAQKAMKALKDMAAPEALLIRDGIPSRVPAAEIVPGDVVMLQAGQVVPADIRVVEARGLKVNEAALTGESVPVEKTAEKVLPPEAPVAERANIAFKGTIIVSGRGKGIAVATGMETELGRIAGLVGGKEEKTPLQKRLADFGRKLSYIILLISLAVFASGLLRGEPVMVMLLTAVSLAVAAIPEALPAVVAVSLAIGAHRMVKTNALVRRLSAVETLGSVDFICTDKTGTLTEGRMSVTSIYSGGKTKARPWATDGGMRLLFMAMALNNDAGKKESLACDPTEAALLEATASAGLDMEAVERDYPRIAEIPFDADRKLMSTFHALPEGGYIMFTKGALEEVLKISDDGTSEEVKVAGENASGDGLRILAFAYKKLPDLPDHIEAEEKGGLHFLGFAGLMDPPRPEARAAIKECASAGITTVMITGDHPATAARIADEIGINGTGVITGGQLAAMDDKELARLAEDARVYARIAPEQKYRIVSALQSRGHFVAMTGDGVNDAPALKKADIGVAMGQCGTEVAREASDLVLLDDNFATIAGAVREGRRIYDNIRKFIKYILISNSGELWTIFLAPFFGLPIPLLPVQILWINLVTDGLPAISLAFEPEEEPVMRRPPRRPDEGIFSGGMGFGIIWVGLLMGAVSIAVQAEAYSGGSSNWQTMVFNVLCFSQLWNAFAMRSERLSLFQMGVFTNKPLLLSIGLSLVLQLFVVYLPALNSLFGTAPLKLSELAISVAVSSIPFAAVEIEKALKRYK